MRLMAKIEIQLDRKTLIVPTLSTLVWNMRGFLSSSVSSRIADPTSLPSYRKIVNLGAISIYLKYCPTTYQNDNADHSA